MGCTVVGMFDREQDAVQARQELVEMGIEPGHIRVNREAAGSTTATARSDEGQGFWHELKALFTGEDDTRYAEYYAEASAKYGHGFLEDLTTKVACSGAQIGGRSSNIAQCWWQTL